MAKKKKKKKDKPKEKKKVGRPTKYRPELCKIMIEWFDRELTDIKEVERISNGEVVTVKEEKPNKPPMFGQFARKVAKVHHQTMLKWCEEFPEFNEAYKECKNIQKEWIVMGCLMGHLSATFGRFTLKNISDWRDKVETEVSTGKDGLKLAYALEGKKDDTGIN